MAGAVLNALELASDFSMGDAAAMSFIVTYGDSLEAYHALATLEARGTWGAGRLLRLLCVCDEVVWQGTSMLVCYDGGELCVSLLASC